MPVFCGFSSNTACSPSGSLPSTCCTRYICGSGLTVHIDTASDVWWRAFWVQAVSHPHHSTAGRGEKLHPGKTATTAATVTTAYGRGGDGPTWSRSESPGKSGSPSSSSPMRQPTAHMSTGGPYMYCPLCQPLARLVHVACKPKVAEFHTASLVDQQVLGLNIAVHDTALVDVRQHAAQLVHDDAHGVTVHAACLRLQHLEQVARHKLHDDEEAVPHVKLVDEPHHVLMLQRAQQLDLAASRALDVIGVGVVVLNLEALDRDAPPRAVAHRALHHEPVRALPDNVFNLVLAAQHAYAVHHNVVGLGGFQWQWRLLAAAAAAAGIVGLKVLYNRRL
eukprot:352668-Chlamydomonas_euryale.AAC.2